MKLVRFIGTRDRVSIPVKFLDRMGLTVGDELIVKITKNGYIVKGLPDSKVRADVIGKNNVISVVTIGTNRNAQVAIPVLNSRWGHAGVKLLQTGDRITITSNQ